MKTSLFIGVYKFGKRTYQNKQVICTNLTEAAIMLLADLINSAKNPAALIKIIDEKGNVTEVSELYTAFGKIVRGENEK